MVYQDRLEKKLLQLFTLPENSENLACLLIF